MSKYVISSGHSLKVRGAAGFIDEVDEARKVVKRVCSYLSRLGATVHEFHDNVSTAQSANINTIVKYHNSKSRDLDVSVHFNAASVTNDPRGVEVLYFSDSQRAISDKLSKAIADVSGLKNRGAKKRDNLGFLKNTKKPAILIEVCFVDSKADCAIYQEKFDDICKVIAETLTGKQVMSPPKAAGTPLTQAPRTSPTPQSTSTNKDGVRMYKPSNQAFIDSTARVLSRLSNKESHGDNAISTTHREKLVKGELPIDDAIAMIFVALDRGMIQGNGKVDTEVKEALSVIENRIETLENKDK